MNSELHPVFESARRAGRRVLLETEALEIARSLGLGVPHHRVVAEAEKAADVDLGEFPGERLVVKVLSPEILHKSDVGGVAVIAKDRGVLAQTLAAMARRLAGYEIAGFGVFEYVEHPAELGGELLLGMRWTDDFGPVVSVGLGGVTTEILAGALEPSRGPAILSPALHTSEDAIRSALEGRLATTLALEGVRGQEPLLERGRWVEILKAFLAFAGSSMPHEIAEFELNPIALTARGPVALDALLKLGPLDVPASAPPRPLDKLGKLLAPSSAAVVGVSRAMNPGHVIVSNLLEMGFPRERLYVVKPGGGDIEGCPVVEDLAALPERVDLLVLSVAAERSGELLAEAIELQTAESVILIPGGLGERPGTESLAAEIRHRLDTARSTPWRGPVVNGGNCLGVRAAAGRLDTTFIPRHKLSYPEGPPTPLAVLSQSGAFAVARASRLAELNPRHLVSLGNQIDLTLADYLEYLASDREVDVFACYLEGWRPLDGRRFLETASKLSSEGRAVILYPAGRTAEGAGAAASHTASIAGDHTVTRELARAAGCVVAETLADFDDLVSLFCALREKRSKGLRLGALSNAGFECVAIADHLGDFELASFTPKTRDHLRQLLEDARLGEIVEPRNPLDTTPILGDEAYAEAARAILTDPGVDAAVIGCVPLTGALQTLPESSEHPEDLESETSIASRLGNLWQETEKPWLAVVDAGPPYDAMARRLRELGIPTFRTADRALRLFGTWSRWQLSHPTSPDPNGVK